MGFSENLSRLMAEHSETNYRLAKILGVHQTSIKNWLDGAKPHRFCLQEIAKHYGCTVDELLLDDREER